MEYLLEGCSPFSSFRGHHTDLRRPWVFPPQQMHTWLPVGHKPGSRTMGLRAAPRMWRTYAEPVVGALSCWGWETIHLRDCPPRSHPSMHLSGHPLFPGAPPLFLQLRPQLPSILQDKLRIRRAHLKRWPSGLGMWWLPSLSQSHPTYSPGD